MEDRYGSDFLNTQDLEIVLSGVSFLLFCMPWLELEQQMLLDKLSLVALRAMAEEYAPTTPTQSQRHESA